MKKREWIILGVITVIAITAIFYMKQKPKASGYVVAVQRGSNIVMEFDPMVDAVYQVDGDYGGLEIEVKDGKWHVINEHCPNHICANMGWMGTGDALIPITCIPNNIMIFLEESPK
jgi:hypothetical protein